jgi:hypothetical protein
MTQTDMPLYPRGRWTTGRSRRTKRILNIAAICVGVVIVILITALACVLTKHHGHQ